ncbi:MAG: cupin domain-containing protein [Halorientalis sp.]
MPATHVDDEVDYGGDRFTARELSRTDRSKAVCASFEPGQFIPVHAPDSDVTVVVQRGHGVVRDGDTDHEVRPGSVVTIPAGRDRGVRADDDRLAAVLVTAPPPTDAEHDLVRRGLRTGEFEP